MRALQIDHVQSDGYKSISAWPWLLWDICRHPKRYQCLCANCNWIKRHDKHEHPGQKRKPLALDDRFSWIDGWVQEHGLRPIPRRIGRQKPRTPRPQYRDMLARAKALRVADKEKRKAEQEQARQAERISAATDPLAFEFLRQQRERLWR